MSKRAFIFLRETVYLLLVHFLKNSSFQSPMPEAQYASRSFSFSHHTYTHPVPPRLLWTSAPGHLFLFSVSLLILVLIISRTEHDSILTDPCIQPCSPPDPPLHYTNSLTCVKYTDLIIIQLFHGYLPSSLRVGFSRTEKLIPSTP